MATPFLGEIKVFAGNFAPRGWAFCNGQLVAISQNDALYALIGTTFGGDGQVTFGLPDLRGRVAVGQGQGPGLSSRVLGQAAGTELVTLTVPQTAGHTHQLLAYDTPATSADPNGRALARAGLANPSEPAVGNSLFYLDAATGSPNTAALPGDFFANAGGNQPHNNMMPFLALNFVIALAGVFPSRN